MPRKVKTEKSPLQFLERSLCGARRQNAPEVRAAVHPRDFFTDRREQDTTALRAWVSPQIQASAAAPGRRGRRRCQPAVSVLDSRSQLDGRRSVCKFPPLAFTSRSRNQPQQQSARGRKTGAQDSDTPKRQVTSVRKSRAARGSDGGASSGRCSIQPEAAPVPPEQRGESPATAASSSFDPPPNVDTPDVIQEGRKGSSPSPPQMFHRSSSPCNQPPDILVADTPEGDYGLKVTWRRRKDLMRRMKERGHLSDSDVLILSSNRDVATATDHSDI